MTLFMRQTQLAILLNKVALVQVPIRHELLCTDLRLHPFHYLLRGQHVVSIDVVEADQRGV